MKNKNLFIWLLIITITIIIIFNIKSCNNTIKNNRLIESLNDSISYYKDKNGILHSKISVIEVERMKDFTKLNLTNKELKELQELVKKYKNVKSATIIKTETKVVEKIVNKIPDDLLTIKHKFYIIQYLRKRRDILLNIIERGEI